MVRRGQRSAEQGLRRRVGSQMLLATVQLRSRRNLGGILSIGVARGLGSSIQDLPASPEAATACVGEGWAPPKRFFTKSAMAELSALLSGDQLMVDDALDRDGEGTLWEVKRRGESQ